MNHLKKKKSLTFFCFFVKRIFKTYQKLTATNSNNLDTMTIPSLYLGNNLKKKFDTLINQ